MTSVMFVCLGNICRSPAGEGIMRHLAEKGNLDILVKSSGMGDWHIGHLPDERMRDAAKDRGVTLSSRAQKFHPKFFQEFDYILAADNEVLRDLYKVAQTPEDSAKIHLITAFSSSYKDEEIPDPYYQGEGAFNLVLDMLEDSCEGLIEEIRKKNKESL